MRKSILFLALVVSMAVSAATTVGVDNQKIVLNRDGQITVLAPNGQDESYYWVSLSPDGSQILYSTAHHGTCVCDLQGRVLRNLGRLNAPKWMDNENVSGMQEHYSETDHDLVDYINYVGCDLNTLKQRRLTKAEKNEFIRLENARLAEADKAGMARAAQRRAQMGTSLQGLKIYVNAGHGGHDLNDRSCWTVPIPETWTNPLGYWESNSNLVKALALRDLLEAAGATVIMSRTTNNSGSRDIQYYNYQPGTPEYNAIMAGDDRDLSAIAEEANANQVDHFLSIHSNAQNGRTNYLLLLYHGEDGHPTVPTSDIMAAASGNIQKLNALTVWITPGVHVRGDITFYGDKPTDPYPGLGVLRPLTVPGFLSEGSFHDYAPETHRLCNADYCKLEALRFFQHFHRYFNRTLPQTATISGWVKSGNEKVDVLGEKNFYYAPGTDDQWLPLNGSKVVLINDAGQRIDSVITDDWYNGIFAFYDLQPGTYQVEASHDQYSIVTQTVTVVAEDIACVKAFLMNTQLDTPDYEDPDQYPGSLPLSKYDFTPDDDPRTGNVSITRAIYKNGKMVTLGSDGLLLRSWAFTGGTRIPLPEGVVAGQLTDVAFSADGFLVASAVISNSLKIYAWDHNMANPSLLLTVPGMTFYDRPSIAASGAMLKVKIFFETAGKVYSIQEGGTPTQVSTTTAGAKLVMMPNGTVYADRSNRLPTFFKYAGNTYMVTPMDSASLLGFKVYDITTGVASRKLVSDTYLMTGTTTQKAMALAYVDRYSVHIGLVGTDNAQYNYGRWTSVDQPIANIYASEASFDGTNFKFRLNENATSVLLRIEKDGEVVDTYELGALNKGAHSVANPFGNQGFTSFTITPTATPVGYPVKISGDAPIFQFYAPTDVAVDRNPTSPYFGRIYVSESKSGSTTSRTTTQGCYVLSSDFTDITGQGVTAWNGNVEWATENSFGDGTKKELTLSHLFAAPSGKVFVCSSAVSSSNVYIMDAANPSADFTPVFGGKRNKDTGAWKSGGATVANPIMGCVVLGVGAEETLYTMDRCNSYATAFTNINQYNIGQVDSLPWKQAPSDVIFADNNTYYMENGLGEIAYDGHGGWFLSQYRYGSTTAKPALLHVTNGIVDYNCGNEITTCNRGGMAVTQDGSMLAIAREGGVVAVYDVEYDANNVPSLSEEKFLINWGSDSDYSIGLDFDIAGNLYITSYTNERLMVYALPKIDNSYTTRISYNHHGEGLWNTDEQTHVRKVVRDGQILILKGDKTYNALGVELR
ncbi:MAG: N-acetylmuramoyl-L-alanine amidase [Paludibacteraceae bacterium]|nr:N-acetylmuramoyl-L-alanine amidase [Paludibacteraceae bacterium]